MYGPAEIRATMRRHADDFVVHERMDHVPSGQGEHLWLHIEKRGLTTDAVRDRLARTFAVGDRDVGHAGLKDRHACTRQWMSVRIASGVDVPDALARFVTPDESMPIASLSVLEHARHTRKLRIGAHAGNAFRLTLRDVVPIVGADSRPDGRIDDATAHELAIRLERRAEAIRAGGLPNRFGAQRYGAEADNVAAARRWFADVGQRSSRSRKLSRRRRGQLLSSARSHCFDSVLERRVARGDWTELLDGEPAMLAGSRSVFVPTAAERAEAQSRVDRFDLSTSAPLPGRGASLARGDCATFEADALDVDGDLVAGLVRAGVEVARRPMRVAVPDLAMTLDGSVLTLAFSLPPGSYATSLLDLFGAVADDRGAGDT